MNRKVANGSERVQVRLDMQFCHGGTEYLSIHCTSSPITKKKFTDILRLGIVRYRMR